MGLKQLMKIIYYLMELLFGKRRNTFWYFSYFTTLTILGTYVMYYKQE